MSFLHALIGFLVSLIGGVSMIVCIASGFKATKFAKTKFDPLQAKLQHRNIEYMDWSYKYWVLLGYSADLLTKRSVRKELENPDSPYHHLSAAEIKEVGSFLRTSFISAAVIVLVCLIMKLLG